MLATIALVSAWSFVKDFAVDRFKDAGGDYVNKKLDNVFEQAARRINEGNQPDSQQLQAAFYTALGQTTRCLAYRLYDPERQPALKLLQKISDWPQFFRRVVEVAQNNIVAGTPGEYWLEKLIDESKDPENFHDFSPDLAMDGQQITRLLREPDGASLRENITRAFLDWVTRHVPDNGGKPSDFAGIVTRGWPTGGDAGQTLGFYDVFSLFFREQLKGDDEIFRAFSLDIFTGLSQNVEEIKANLPDPKVLQEFTETLRTFGEQGLGANYSRFQTWITAQNQELFLEIKAGFSDVQKHLTAQDNTLADIGQQIRDLNAKLEAAQKRNIPGSELLAEFRQKAEETRFSASAPKPDQCVASALAEVARAHGITADELRQKILAAAQNALERRELASQLRRAAETETIRLQQIECDAAKDLAVAAYAQNDFNQALGFYTEALELTDQTAVPREWASLQNLLGGCHWALAARTEGAASAQHLQAATAAINAALKVVAREVFPQDWAKTQNDLGLVLWTQARWNEGPDAGRLLGEAVAAYHEALKVRTQTAWPRAWASTQVNLGAALMDQATRSEGAEAVRLRGEAMTAFNEALKVNTRDSSPQDWAATQNNLGIALTAQSMRSEGPGAVRLLTDAVAAYNEALKVRKRETLPEAWAATQDNLGIAFRALAERTEGPASGRLLGNAVTAFRAVLTVETREALPQDWAATQSNLGNALCLQAGRSEGTEAVRLLGEAVTALNEALKVYTRKAFPQNWAGIQNDLALALRAQARLSPTAEALRLLGDAAAACRGALTVRTRETLPQDWARTQDNLGSALSMQAERSTGAGVAQLLDDAVTAYRAALTVYTREEFPQDWANAQNNLGNALGNQARRKEATEAPRLLGEAVTAYREALKVRAREVLPVDWAMTQFNLGGVLRVQARWSEGTEAVRLLGEAAAAYRNAMAVYTKEQFPQIYKLAANFLAEAEAALLKLNPINPPTPPQAGT